MAGKDYGPRGCAGQSAKLLSLLTVLVAFAWHGKAGTKAAVTKKDTKRAEDEARAWAAGLSRQVAERKARQDGGK